MEVKIIKFDHFGRGIGYYNGKIVFVNKALPNEIVDIKIIKEKSKFYEGEIINIINESEERIESICPYYSLCGGCNLLHMNYELEKQFKINKCKELLGRCDNFYETNDLNYRNKVTLHVKDNRLGFYKEKTNDIIPIDYCHLLNDKINDVIKKLQKLDLKNINEIIIKSNNKDVLLNIKGKLNINELHMIDVNNIIVNNKLVKGNNYIEEIIHDKLFKLTSEAFFQVNKSGLLNIYNVIEKFLKDKKINNALDLYSGIGLWGILISDYVNNVTCIEINEEACQNANYNILKNNIHNVQVINGKVEDYIDRFNNIDLVITDPPRSGLDNKTKDYLKKIQSKYFIYVSCDMQTLKRDLEDLKDTYTVNEINIVDMFKRTYHVECVLLLCRKTLDK